MKRKVVVKGDVQEFESPFTDEETLLQLEQVKGEFPESLCKQAKERGLIRMSSGEINWIHKLVVDQSASQIRLFQVTAMMQLARENGVQWPIIRVEIEDYPGFRLSFANDQSINVISLDKSEFYGRILTDCRLQTDRMPGPVIQALVEFNKEPVKRYASLWKTNQELLFLRGKDHV